MDSNTVTAIATSLGALVGILGLVAAWKRRVARHRAYDLRDAARRERAKRVALAEEANRRISNIKTPSVARAAADAEAYSLPAMPGDDTDTVDAVRELAGVLHAELDGDTWRIQVSDDARARALAEAASAATAAAHQDTRIQLRAKERAALIADTVWRRMRQAYRGAVKANPPQSAAWGLEYLKTMAWEASKKTYPVPAVDGDRDQADSINAALTEQPRVAAADLDADGGHWTVRPRIADISDIMNP